MKVKLSFFFVRFATHNCIGVFRNSVTEIIPENLNRIMPAEEMQVYKSVINSFL